MNLTYDKKGHAVKLDVTWVIDDVIWRAKDRGVKLSRAEASEVMGKLYKRHDASIGINWEVIDVWIDDVISERKG